MFDKYVRYCMLKVVNTKLLIYFVRCPIKTWYYFTVTRPCCLHYSDRLKTVILYLYPSYPLWYGHVIRYIVCMLVCLHSREHKKKKEFYLPNEFYRVESKLFSETTNLTKHMTYYQRIQAKNRVLFK